MQPGDTTAQGSARVIEKGVDVKTLSVPGLYYPQDIFDNVIGTSAVHSKSKINYSLLFS